VHWPAVRADVSKFSAFRRASQVKEHGVRVEKANIVEPQLSVEESMAEMPNIYMCITSKICKRQNCWRNLVLFGNF
jgi:hypothetical protein